MTQRSLQSTRACVFDVYGTLFDFNTPLIRTVGKLGDRANELGDLWRKKQIEYSWLRSMMNEVVDFWRITVDALEYALEAVGIDDDALRAELLNLYVELDPYPEVPALLDQLDDDGVACAILTNGSRNMLLPLLEKSPIGDKFATVLTAESAGAFKPDRRVYELVTDKLALNPDAICYLSANAWDVHGTAVFGFKTVWVNRAGAPAERLPGKPAAEVSDLSELPALLR